MRKLILMVLLAVLALPVWTMAGDLYNPRFFGSGLGAAPYNVGLTVRNRTGDSARAGDVVVWKQDSISVIGLGSCGGHGMATDDTYVINKTLSPGDSGLGSMAGQFKVFVEVHGTPSTDYVYIMGKGDKTGGSYTTSNAGWGNIKDTILLTAGADSFGYMSKARWERIDSIRTASLAVDSLRLRASELFAVTTTTTAASKKVAGVIATTVANNAWARCIIWGFARVNMLAVKSTVSYAGTYLETSATARKAQVNATPAAGCGFGKLLEATAAGGGSYAGATALRLAFITPAY